MQKFNSNGVEIAFWDTGGSGVPVLLIHGFASNHHVNWVATGWQKVLAEAGHRVIMLDNRGHGFSDKPHDSQAYPAPVMAEDALRLLDHLKLRQTKVMGYSMGARISAFLTLNAPERVTRLVLAGLAERLFIGVPGAETIAAGLEATSLADVTDPGARSFRIFAEQTKSDLRALAACMRSTRVKIKPEALATISCPVLVVAGSEDEVAGRIEPLVSVIPGAKGVSLQGRNHMNAVGDKQFKAAVLEFFASTDES